MQEGLMEIYCNGSYLKSGRVLYLPFSRSLDLRVNVGQKSFTRPTEVQPIRACLLHNHTQTQVLPIECGTISPSLPYPETELCVQHSLHESMH
jgi:hypothetical protein